MGYQHSTCWQLACLSLLLHDCCPALQGQRGPIQQDPDLSKERQQVLPLDSLPTARPLCDRCPQPAKKKQKRRPISDTAPLGCNALFNCMQWLLPSTCPMLISGRGLCEKIVRAAFCSCSLKQLQGCCKGLTVRRSPCSDSASSLSGVEGHSQSQHGS